MKFSQFMEFNAVPEWLSYYLPYSDLKTLVYNLEEERRASVLNEHTPLLSSSDSIFLQAVDQSLASLIQFYTEKECEAKVRLEHILTLPFKDSVTSPITIVVHEPPSAPSSSSSSSSSLGTINEERKLSADMSTIAIPTNALDKTQLEQNQRLIDLYICLGKLKSFVFLNQIALTQILKKYDKVMGTKLDITYTQNKLQHAYPFQPSTCQHLDNLLQQVEDLYRDSNSGKEDGKYLSECLRHSISMERDATLIDRIERERRVETPKEKNKKMISCFGLFQVEAQRLKTCIYLALSLILFVYLMNSTLFQHIEQRRCFAILVFGSVLWATELMPLFVTALLVPFLAIVLRVIRSEQEASDGTVVYERLSAMEASKVVFASMLSPVIMLLLGGFAIAAALNKYGIAKALASFVLSKAGTRPSRVLLVNMLVASMASMWISNVAAPVLCISLIQPILRSLPTESPFAPCLLMGIALASNLGGIASPIASPQNVIAIQNMSPPPSWTDWFCVSIPLCLLGNCIVWLWLLRSYKINNEHQVMATQSCTTTNNRLSSTQLFIACVTLFTIVLWCIARTYRDTLGDMGVIAIIPIVAFFGTGILTKDEFNGFLWNVIVLAMGGIALGKAVESSGLLQTIAVHISEHVMTLSSFEVLFVFSLLVLVIATFISHTVAALIVLPIVAKIGTHLSDPNPRLLVMGTAFVCSAAMGLPVSGFPNMTAISQENRIGEPYLKTRDFLRNGVPCSVLIMLCIVTLGYGLMLLVGL